MNPAADSAFTISVTVSPEYIPGITSSTPLRCCFKKSIVVALEMDSQYVILPLLGVNTTRPGSEEDAEGETSAPRGRGSVEFLEG